ncbi:MAG: hypothetical protein N4A50_06310 [Vallitalea sp.]|jgi:hypothetical protein|nr:hypothetical protein [Vallitalea sp.]
MLIIKYDTEQEAELIKKEKTSQGYTLVEIANITEGNFLGFDDTPIQPPNNPQPTSLEKRLEEMQSTIDLLLLKQEGLI